VVLVRSAGVAREVWRPVLLQLVVIGGAAVALAVAVSTLLAKRLTDPLHRLADASARLAGGDLPQRVEVTGDDELAHLASRFNAMADSLAEARRREHEFLASVSHELRTPITAIRGYAEAIEDGSAKGASIDDAVRVIQEEASRLERLAQDVVDLARLGAEEFRLEPVDVDLAVTIDEASRAHLARAQQAGVTLTATSEGAMRAVTDPGRVRQIISNLVENALRVTPDGGEVRITGRAREHAIEITVSDTGPGIAPEDLPHVFERSYLWSRSRAVRPVGTGLGLAIVRELADALGGTITVSSEPGRGSAFVLSVPLSPRSG
jgi:two-component system, OmpR family, sensor kinase